VAYICVCVHCGCCQDASEKGMLSWLPTVTHTYAKAANFTVWAEAFTGVGSVIDTAIIPVYGE